MTAALPRILFVDDEISVLEALENLLRRARNAWSLSFVQDAGRALDEIDERPVDVVVSDLRMPGTDGAALLEAVRQRSPGTVRIALSGNAERDMLIRALPVAHRLLSKPCDASLLRHTLDQLAALLAEISDREDWRRASMLSCLPSESLCYEQFVEAARRYQSDEVAEVAERDPAIAAKLLQIAGSGSTNAPSDHIQGALHALEPELLRALASDPRMFTPATEALRDHTREVQQQAARAAHLAHTDAPKRAGRAYTETLLATVGHLVPDAHEPDLVTHYLHGLWALPHRPLERR